MFERVPESEIDEARFLISETVEFLPLIDMWYHLFFDRAPNGYYMIGFHDPGFYNFYFYYARVDDWRKLYFRLNYGGVYTDEVEERERVAEFLEEYCRFEEKLEGRVKRLEFEVIPGEVKYRILLLDSTTWNKEYKASTPLWGQEQFEREFSELLQVIDRQNSEL